eukprot:c18056_g1_i3.p1 GENE.c18056_g1_i3~~c18056_g1_i3.p1  ORF type:complete len:109 (+),score=10.08 c18056_g1_i3:504-830(+)
MGFLLLSVGHISSHPALLNQTAVLSNLIDCLRETLQGRSYPPNTREFYTPWKLMMGISNLARNSLHCEALCRAGLMTELRNALQSPDSSELTKYTLTTLWNVLKHTPE